MSPKKLTPADKSEILTLYRLADETTSSLAIRYGVSTSTISRFLKSNLNENEYDILIQQKRAIRISANGAEMLNESDSTTEDISVNSEDIPPVELIPESESENDFLSSDSINMTTTEGRRRKRSSAGMGEVETMISSRVSPSIQQLEIALEPITTPEEDETDLEDNYSQEKVLAEMLGEELGLDDADIDDDIDDDDEDDDDDNWEDNSFLQPQFNRRVFIAPSRSSLQVLPLANAVLPKVCYIVVDRLAELITRPLKDFSDLGGIPVDEVGQKTLPVFDNHRVAKRFSNRNHRVIKVPDSRMLKKTSSHLQAKGITRLLIDGQVYSLT
jgi:hypothetical protein